MIEIRPTLKIGIVEKLRNECLQKQLDVKDNLSCHMLMSVNGAPVGVCRFYKSKGDVIIDNLALKKDFSIQHREILLRSTISHAMNYAENLVKINEDESEILSEMGFERKENSFVSKVENIVFTCKCHK